MELQNYSTAEATGGPAGLTGLSTGWTSRFPKKEQGFLQLLAFSPCFLRNQQRLDRVGDLDVGAGVEERLERGIFTELGIFGVLARDETRLTWQEG